MSQVCNLCHLTVCAACTSIYLCTGLPRLSSKHKWWTYSASGNAYDHTSVRQATSFALQDDDPYVRKTAAVCVAKLHDINPELVEDRGFLDTLKVGIALGVEQAAVAAPM